MQFDANERAAVWQVLDQVVKVSEVEQGLVTRGLRGVACLGRVPCADRENEGGVVHVRRAPQGAEVGGRPVVLDAYGEEPAGCNTGHQSTP